jgi:hypothetical protein
MYHVSRTHFCTTSSFREVGQMYILSKSFKALWLLYVPPPVTIIHLHFNDKMYFFLLYDSRNKQRLFP